MKTLFDGVTLPDRAKLTDHGQALVAALEAWFTADAALHAAPGEDDVREARTYAVIDLEALGADTLAELLVAESRYRFHLAHHHGNEESMADVARHREQTRTRIGNLAARLLWAEHVEWRTVVLVLPAGGPSAVITGPVGFRVDVTGVSSAALAAGCNPDALTTPAASSAAGETNDALLAAEPALVEAGHR